MPINIVALLPSIVTVMAEVINIDYSKQPPRDLQLSAGASMAVAGFIVTFLVLGIFTILIKIVAVIGERMEAKKASVPAVPTSPAPQSTPSATPVPSLDIDIVAVAVAAATMYLKKKKAKREGGAVDAWVIGERVAPPGSSALDELALRETTKWRRNE